MGGMTKNENPGGRRRKTIGRCPDRNFKTPFIMETMDWNMHVPISMT